MSDFISEFSIFGITPCTNGSFGLQTPAPEDPYALREYYFPCVLVDAQYRVESILISIFPHGKYDIYIAGDVQPARGFFAPAIRKNIEERVTSAMETFLRNRGEI